jgi:hypothetical protein
MKNVVIQLRIIGRQAVEGKTMIKEESNKTLRRILRLFEKTSFRDFADVSVEISTLIRIRSQNRVDGNSPEPQHLALIQYFADEAIPGDVLKALASEHSSSSHHAELLPSLRTLLSRGAATGSELSASLLRIKKARQMIENRPASLDFARAEVSDLDFASNKQSIWKRMSSGMVTMDK